MKGFTDQDLIYIFDDKDEGIDFVYTIVGIILFPLTLLMLLPTLASNVLLKKLFGKIFKSKKVYADEQPVVEKLKYEYKRVTLKPKNRQVVYDEYDVIDKTNIDHSLFD